VIGVVLTGFLSDGTAGLIAIRAAGGLAVIQDPEDASVAAMPQSAVQIAGPDYTARLADVAPLLIKLVPVPETPGRVGAETMYPIERMRDVVDKNMARQLWNERRGD
jgi:two-component system chemotaxis response regulator CheB